MPPMMPAMPTNVVTVSPGRLPSQAFTMGPYTVPRYPQTVISPAHRTVVYTLQRWDVKEAGLGQERYDKMGNTQIRSICLRSN